MTEASYQTITSRLIEQGAVQHIVLDGGKGNILTTAMMVDISAALESHRDEPALRLVLISSTPKYFSFGAAIEEHTRERVGEMLPAFHRFIRALASHPVAVAALVEGSCLGGAFELVLACHFVLATSKARFGCPEITLGVYPPVLAALGPSRLGAALSERLVLTGQTIDAEAAARAGWLAALLEPAPDGVEAALGWYRERLAPLSAFALRQAVAVARDAAGVAVALGEPLERAERRYLAELVPSHDGNEGIAAFMAKRPAVWRNA